MWQILLCGIFLCFIVFAVLVWFATESFIRPIWYRDKKLGHQNRSPKEGLVSEVMGRAEKSWRISGSCKGTGNPKSDLGIDFSTIEIPCINARHIILRGWLLLSSDTCIITIHGGGRDRRAFLRHVPLFYKKGFSMILFDLQEHGISDGNQRGIGWCTYEQQNILSVVKFAKETYHFKHVILLGTSMGASASIIAAGLGANCNFHPTPTMIQETTHKSIDAVIAENPFCTRKLLLEDILDSFLSKFSFLYRLQLAKLLKNTVVKLTLWRLKDPLYPNPIDAVEHVKIPLLLMHGKEDSIISPHHSEILYSKNKQSNVALWIAEGGEHTTLFDSHRTEWENHVMDTIAKIQ